MCVLMVGDCVNLYCPFYSLDDLHAYLIAQRGEKKIHLFYLDLFLYIRSVQRLLFFPNIYSIYYKKRHSSQEDIT